MKILGIETSCDETGVAVYDTDTGLLAESLASQVDLHAAYGGVVPELASRDHAARLLPLVAETVRRSGLRLADLDAVAYTAGPGLIGALMVGGAFASALAFGLRVPAIPVHHMEGHLLAPLLELPAPRFPFVALLVSGGHTQLVAAEALGHYRTIGRTLDDAAGEAFDKVARLLGLGYPGGPAVAAHARDGDAAAFSFPRPLAGRGLDFSFSGLKTAVWIALDRLGSPLSATASRDVAASFQQAVVDSLTEKSLRALEVTGYDSLIVAGGVGANQLLRQQLKEAVAGKGCEVFFPRVALCTDNGAMIAFAGAQRLQAGAGGTAGVIARPRWPLDALVTVAAS